MGTFNLCQTKLNSIKFKLCRCSITHFPVIKFIFFLNSAYSTLKLKLVQSKMTGEPIKCKKHCLCALICGLETSYFAIATTQEATSFQIGSSQHWRSIRKFKTAKERQETMATSSSVNIVNVNTLKTNPKSTISQQTSLSVNIADVDG